MTLNELYILRRVLALRRVFVLAGLDPVTMRSRIRRGGPELTEAESAAIHKVLYESGLHYVNPNEVGTRLVLIESDDDADQ